VQSVRCVLRGLLRQHAPRVPVGAAQQPRDDAPLFRARPAGLPGHDPVPQERQRRVQPRGGPRQPRLPLDQPRAQAPVGRAREPVELRGGAQAARPAAGHGPAPPGDQPARDRLPRRAVRLRPGVRRQPRRGDFREPVAREPADLPDRGDRRAGGGLPADRDRRAERGLPPAGADRRRDPDEQLPGADRRLLRRRDQRVPHRPPLLGRPAAGADAQDDRADGREGRPALHELHHPPRPAADLVRDRLAVV
ncbi:MAG: hypothetical protein AVDCRST_MAG64-1969, partial [uncultured Phycisphaerae bacterium]